MTDQLRTVLASIADESGPAPRDPTLWRRARRSRRRRGTAAASGLVAGVIGLVVVAAALNTGTDRQSSPPAVENLRPGLPTVVHGVDGDGGLPLETNLAVGRASVAFSNDEAAFVVTSADGAYHRLHLPGFDPGRYDAAHPGLALSPDGRKLVFTSEEDGSGQGARPNVVDLSSGRVQKLHVSVAEITERWNVIAAFDYNWSSNSIHLTYEVWAPVEWGQPLHCCGHGYAAVDTDIGAPVYVTSRWTADDPDAGNDLPRSHSAFPGVAVSPKRLVAKIDNGAFDYWEFGGGGNSSQALTDIEDWEVRQFSADGSAAALQPRGVGHALGVVRSSTAWGSVAVLPLDAERWPQGAHIEVLGWVGETQLLVLVHPATGAETWEPGGDLTLFNTDPAVAATTIGRVDRAEGMSAFTFASDLASTLPSTATP